MKFKSSIINTFLVTTYILKSETAVFDISVLKHREYMVKINFLFHYDTKIMNLELLVIATKLDKPRQVLLSINDKTRSNAQYVKITVVWKSLCHLWLTPQDIWMLKIMNE
jgi:hypothetical protein